MFLAGNIKVQVNLLKTLPFLMKNFVLYRHTVFNKSIDSGTQQLVGYFDDLF